MLYLSKDGFNNDLAVTKVGFTAISTSSLFGSNHLSIGLFSRNGVVVFLGNDRLAHGLWVRRATITSFLESTTEEIARDTPGIFPTTSNSLTLARVKTRPSPRFLPAILFDWIKFCAAFCLAGDKFDITRFSDYKICFGPTSRPFLHWPAVP